MTFGIIFIASYWYIIIGMIVLTSLHYTMINFSLITSFGNFWCSYNIAQMYWYVVCTPRWYVRDVIYLQDKTHYCAIIFSAFVYQTMRGRGELRHLTECILSPTFVVSSFRLRSNNSQFGFNIWQRYFRVSLSMHARIRHRCSRPFLYYSCRYVKSTIK